MERVRRLLAIANDPAASDNEQRIALEQAQRLMDKHAIEEWQLEENHDDVEIIKRRIRLNANPCNRYMVELANIVARGNRCRASYGCRRAGNGRDVISAITIYGTRGDVDKTEAIWTAMETSRAAMWRERARATPHAKANAAWRNGYYRGFQEEIARRYQVLRLEMESDGTGKELVTVRSGQVDQWIETHVTFIAHNAEFDVSFLDAAERVYDPTASGFDCRWLCTKEMSWELNPQKQHHRLTDLIADYHIGDTEEHRALADAIQEQMIYRALCHEATMRGKWIGQ